MPQLEDIPVLFAARQFRVDAPRAGEFRKRTSVPAAAVRLGISNLGRVQRSESGNGCVFATNQRERRTVLLHPLLFTVDSQPDQSDREG